MKISFVASPKPAAQDIVEQIPNLSETRVSCHCDAAMTLLLERDANHERLPLR